MPKKSQAEQRPENADPRESVNEAFDPLEDRFFASPSLSPVEFKVGAEEGEHEAQRLGPEHPRAMRVTIGMTAFALVTLSGFLLYHKVLMPTPVELGQGAPVLTLPELAEPVVEPPPRVALAAVPAHPRDTDTELISAGPSGAQAVDGETRAEPVQDPAMAIELPASNALAKAEPVAPAAKRTRPRRRAGAGGRPRTRLAREAFASLNRGEFNRAEQLAARATVAHPSDADGWMVLAAARDAMGDLAGAQRAYRMCSARVTGHGAQNCQRLSH